MSLLRFFSPVRAYADLRLFFSRRRPHEMVFAALAIAIPILIVSMIAHDAHYEPEYHPNIIYVQQWPLNRSEAEILAQQKLDQAAKDKRQAEVDREEARRRAQFKQVDDALKRYGI